jgi:zeta-carotene desaturase
MSTPLPIAVVGGGVAGLAAATALAEAGALVHLFEARPRLGGRAATFRDPATGERIDNGQHVLAGCYTETFRFLSRIGSASRVHLPSALSVPLVDFAGETTLVLPPLPSPFDLLAGVLAWDALDARERWAIVRLARALQRGDVRSEETVRAWLARHGQSPRICRLLWEPLALAALNQPIDRAAATMFVAVATRMFGGATPAGSTIVIPAVTLDELYVEPAVRFLHARGARVSTGTRASIACKDGRVHAVCAGGEAIAVSAAVCAVPWHALADTCRPAPPALEAIAGAAAAMTSSPIVTVNVWLDDEIDARAFVGLPGRTFQWVFNRRRIIGDAQRHLSMVSSGADEICARPNGELIALALEELRHAFPRARAARLEHASVVRERRATFGLEPGGPPRPPAVTPVANLVLAGDWIDTGLPATIESAATAGHEAARALLASHGVGRAT